MADLVYPPVIGLVRATFAALGLRFTVSGEEHVPRTGGAVMAINHTGYLDFTFAGLPARKHRRLVRFMAKDVTFKHPVSGPLMRGMHHIPVNREAGAAAYDAAVQALRAGEIVGVFPETTMSPSFELLPFKQGAARMAQQAGVPILPTVIWGSQRVLTYGRRRPVSLKTIPLSVDVGAPVVVAPDEETRTGGGCPPGWVAAPPPPRRGWPWSGPRRAAAGLPATPLPVDQGLEHQSRPSRWSSVP